jgi:hypothetical protein
MFPVVALCTTLVACADAEALAPRVDAGPSQPRPPLKIDAGDGRPKRLDAGPPPVRPIRPEDAAPPAPRVPAFDAAPPRAPRAPMDAAPPPVPRLPADAAPRPPAPRIR